MEVRPATPLAPPPATVPVFCKDCEHFNEAFRSARPVCMAPAARTIDLVRGYLNPDCERARTNSLRGACGTDGRLFVKAGDGEIASTPGTAREPYAGLSSAPSADNRSSLSKINLASVQSSAITVATASAEYPEPNTDSHIDCAVTSRS